MIRTSVLLSPTLHQELLITSKQEGKGVSELIREVVEQWMEQHRNVQLPHTYKGLDEFIGKGTAGITDASTTIDTLLYGEKGVWKGHDE